MSDIDWEYNGPKPVQDKEADGTVYRWCYNCETWYCSCEPAAIGTKLAGKELTMTEGLPVTEFCRIMAGISRGVMQRSYRWDEVQEKWLPKPEGHEMDPGDMMSLMWGLIPDPQPEQKPDLVAEREAFRTKIGLTAPTKIDEDDSKAIGRAFGYPRP